MIVESPWRAGVIPHMLNEDDPRGAFEQLGQEGFNGFEMVASYGLKYPDDPTIYPVARIRFRDELVLVYPFDWVAVVQRDGAFKVARID